MSILEWGVVRSESEARAIMDRMAGDKIIGWPGLKASLLTAKRYGFIVTIYSWTYRGVCSIYTSETIKGAEATFMGAAGVERAKRVYAYVDTRNK